jgi:lysophospholipase L1-like esterase
VPPGSDITSDPVVFPAAAGTDVAVSFAVQGPAGRASWHAMTSTTSYATVPGAGDHVGDSGGDAFDQPFHSVLWLARLEVETVNPGAVIALGDSLTDGHGLPSDSNARWTDALAERLALAGASSALAVVNAGASGNKVTAPATCDESCGAGPALTARAGQDALDVAGVAGVVIMEGTNDVVAGVPAPAIEADLLAVIAHAHLRGVPVVLVTVPPGNFDPDREQDRQELNAWVRQQAPVEHVVDADVLLRQPGSPSRLDPLYDIGDAIHLTPVAERVLANAFDARWFAQPVASARHAARRPAASVARR